MKTYQEMTSQEFSIEALESSLYRNACEMQNVFTRSGFTDEFRYLERRSIEISKELKELKN
ncbi:hypothetical protein [Patiriisocius marinus]|uniref:hypothetical protein n=1 Tax=Patiriisocius marinus TaxID=1397112 RepID=UPI002330597E|nr:hypothetical protein [Patiriisocius marinus]